MKEAMKVGLDRQDQKVPQEKKEDLAVRDSLVPKETLYECVLNKKIYKLLRILQSRFLYLQGERGLPGLDGISGRPGFPGQKGDAGISTKGEQGDRGRDGYPGAKGEPGFGGPKGEAGALISFCC